MNKVISLFSTSLPTTNLRGTFPAVRVRPNDNLKILDISNNAIEGIAPPASIDYPLLEVLIFSNNNFTGLITGGGGFSAFKLRVIKVDGNQFLGSESASDTMALAFLLKNLEVFNLTNNNYDGKISPSVRFLKNLTYLGIGGNFLSGTIPSEIGLLPRLKGLDVSGNSRISGTIPTEFGLLSDLTFLDVAGTQVRGEFPNQLCQRAANKEADMHLCGNCSLLECCDAC